MDRAVLFRFHKNLSLCKRRISLLQNFNPEVPIYGVTDEGVNTTELTEAGLEHVLFLDDILTGREKWKNGDLVIKEWFDQHGHNVPFDVLHVIEWDLLITAPLEEAYPSGLSRDTVALSGAIPMEMAQRYDWDWATGLSTSSEELFRSLCASFENSTPSATAYAGLYPGITFGRHALKKYAEAIEKLPLIGNDEWRTGVLSPILESEVRDTGFYDGWDTDTISKTFNCMNNTISADKIKTEDQSLAFHPVREPIPESYFE